MKKEVENHKVGHHPLLKQKRTLSQQAADFIASFGGSWFFIGLLLVFFFSWIGLNSWILITKPFDHYPYIFLNLLLAALTTLQAPIILMSQNRQAQRDHLQAKYDYQVNRKSEREIEQVHKELKHIQEMIHELREKK